MKPDKLYQELKDLAEKLGIVVSEQNFRNAGIHVNSGYCKVKDKDHCIINKHLKLNKKLEVIGECLSLFPHDDTFVVPAVRDFLDSFKRPQADESEPGDEGPEK